MTESTIPTENMNWIAIDVAKYWHAVLIEAANGQHYRFKVANTQADFSRLISFLQSLGGPCRAALEPTGDYHRVLAYQLLQAGIEVVAVSTVAACRFREALFNSWDKNDPKDAAVILHMLKQGHTQVYIEPMNSGYHDLQELSKTYYQVSLARTKLQHSIINHHLPLYFPEMYRYFTSTRSNWWICFMQRYPTPAHVLSTDCMTFIAEASQLLGSKAGKHHKLAEIWALAGCSVALPHDPDSLAVQTFRLTLQQYQQLTAWRDQLEKLAHEVLVGTPDYDNLRSLPGVGPILALTILAEAGDIRRFAHHRQFLKYCGLDLAKNQSGVHKGKEQLSKRGNARLRLAFWMAAVIAVRVRENSFSLKYNRYRSCDPHDADRKRKALTAVAAKMARVAYAVIKKNQPYRQFFEQSLPNASIPLTLAVEASASS